MFGEKLKEIRSKKGISQAELAKLLDLTPGAIGMYESNKRTPDLESLKEIAKKLEVHPSFFLDEPKKEFTMNEIKDLIPEDLQELIVSEYKDVVTMIREMHKEQIPADQLLVMLKAIQTANKMNK